MLHCKTVWWREGTESCCLLFTLISCWRRSPGEKEESFPTRQNFHKFLIPKPDVSSCPPKKKKKLRDGRSTPASSILEFSPPKRTCNPSWAVANLFLLSESESAQNQLRLLLADPVVWGGRKNSSLRAESSTSVVWLVFLAGYRSLLFLSCFVGLGFFFLT